MQFSGRPIRLAYVGQLTSTSTVGLTIYEPGITTPYVLQPNESVTIYSYIMGSLLQTVNSLQYGALLVASPASTLQASITTSTLLGMQFGYDSSMALDNIGSLTAPPGITPSVIMTSTEAAGLVYCVATGTINIYPGYQTPNTQLNAGQAWNPLPTFTINVPPSTGAQS